MNAMRNRVIIGDFNCKFNTGKNSKNKEDWEEFMLENNYVRKKFIKQHNGTWFHNATRSWHEIDHVITPKRLAKNIMDINTRFGYDSDPRMKVVRWRPTIVKEQENEENSKQKINVEKLLRGEDREKGGQRTMQNLKPTLGTRRN